MSAIATTFDTEDRLPSRVTIDGGMQFWAGLSYGAASLINYLTLTGHIHLPPPMIGMVWMGASAVFVVFGVVLKLGTPRALLADPAFRRFRAIWGSLILGAAFLVAALIIMMVKFGLPADTAFVVSPIALSVYGIGWRVAAVMSGQRWANLLSIGSFVCALCLATLAGSPNQSLVYSLGLVVFAIVPGLVLLLRRPAPAYAG